MPSASDRRPWEDATLIAAGLALALAIGVAAVAWPRLQLAYVEIVPVLLLARRFGVVWATVAAFTVAVSFSWLDARALGFAGDAWMGSALAMFAVFELMVVLVAGYDRTREALAASRAGEERFHTLADGLPQFVWTYRPDGSVDFVNRTVLDYIGVERYADGADAAYAEATHPADLEAVRELRRTSLADGRAFECEYRVRSAKTGLYRWFLMRVTPVMDETGAVRRWIATAFDVHERKALGESRQRFFSAFAESLPHIVWRAHPDGTREYVNERWSDVTGLSTEMAAGWGWLEAVHPDDIPRVRAAWKRAVRTGEPFEVEFRYGNVSTGAYRWHLMRAVPLFEESGELEAWIGSCADIDDRARREAELRLLLDAGTRLLGAHGEDEAYEATLRVVVPACADIAAVAVFDKGGDARLAALVDRNGPERLGTLEAEFLSATVVGDARRGLPHLWSTLEPAFVGALPEALRTRVLARGAHSGVAVPLATGHRISAVLIAFAASPSRPYDDGDLRFFCELAPRVAAALGSARAFEHERHVAETFQEAALPKALPSHETLAFDASYVPGRRDALVGGDWYDAIELVDGRFLASIGDVTGNGLEAAVTMSVARQAIRTAAHVTADPCAILEAADRALRGDGDRLATAFVALIDPLSDEMWYASAGHPPAVLRRPDGTFVELFTRGLPLGLRTKETSEAARFATLEPGTVVALYTDGLIESTHDIFAGERKLREALADPAVLSAPSTAHALHRAVVSGVARDDVAVLVVRRLLESRSERSSHALPNREWSFQAGDRLAAVSARRAFVEALRDAGVSAQRLENAETVFGELVGNAVCHTKGPIDVRLRWASGHAVLHVLDRGDGYAIVESPPRDPLSEGGRGLFLVSLLARDFSVTPRLGGGTHSRAVLAAGRPPTALRDARVG